METASVVSVEKTVRDGNEVDAINYPDLKKIEIHRSRWNEYGKNLRRKLPIVLHEYLGLMRLGDASYQISSEYLARLNAASTSATRALILRAIDSMCGDTWCEGDYDFEFRYLDCDDSGCHLDFTMRENPGEREHTLAQPPAHPRFEARIHSEGLPARDFQVSCRFSQYKDLNDTAHINVDESHDISIGLEPAFYADLTDCIDALEQGLPPIEGGQEKKNVSHHQSQARVNSR